MLSEDFKKLVSDLVAEKWYIYHQLRTKQYMEAQDQNGMLGELPSGRDFAEFDQWQQDILSNRTQQIWPTIEEALSAFSISYDAALADDLNMLADELILTCRCDPWPYAMTIGTPHPSGDMDEMRRSRLENIRFFALQSIRIRITIYCKRAEMNKKEKPMVPHTTFIGSVVNSSVTVNSPDSTTNTINSSHSDCERILADIEKAISEIPGDAQRDVNQLFSPLRTELSLPLEKRDKGILSRALARFTGAINTAGPVAENLGS